MEQKKDYTPQKLDINHNIHDLSYLDDENYQFIEIPKGYWLNCGRLLDINLNRDQDPEVLQSSSATAIKTKHLPTYGLPGTPDNSQSSGAKPPSTKEARENTATGNDGSQNKLSTPDTPGENALSRDLQSSDDRSLSGNANDTTKGDESGVQPKTICNLSSQSTHAPSAASSNNMEYCLKYNEVIDKELINSCDELDKNIGCCFCQFFEFAELDDCGDD